MRILLANKYYYPRGGDCNYSIGLEQLLKANGHQTAFFAMKHPLNIDSEYSEYFPSEIDFAGNKFSGAAKKIFRPLGSSEVEKNFRRLLKVFKPDIVHVNNIHTQLSPVIVRESYRSGIPVVWTLHDYKLICPRYDCLRDGKPCELCFTKGSFNVIRYCCVKNSLIASILGYAEHRKWSKHKLERYTGKFVCPSEFIRCTMISGGYGQEKFITLNNFIGFSVPEVQKVRKKAYYCYVGRLSHEKGLETLLSAAIDLQGYHLKIVGGGPLTDYFKKKYSAGHIEFCGHRPSEEVKQILSEAVFTVIPSEWYENNPLSIIESLCMGTPVLGADIGGIPEMIEPGKNGALFRPGDKSDLIGKIEYLWNQWSLMEDGKLISKKAMHKFSTERYYHSIMQVYESVLRMK